MTTFDAQQIYDNAADTYARSHARWLRFAGGEAQCAFEGAVTVLLRPGMRMLDAACGTGTVVRRLLGGMDGDIDLVLLDAAQRMLDKCSDIPSLRIKGCMTKLPFDANHFDLLTCAWGIETLVDQRAALAEFIRVTRPGGHVCLAFCADRPAPSIIGRALRTNVAYTGRGAFLNHQTVHHMAKGAGAIQVQTLHCTGPAAAMILHV